MVPGVVSSFSIKCTGVEDEFESQYYYKYQEQYIPQYTKKNNKTTLVFSLTFWSQQCNNMTTIKYIVSIYDSTINYTA